MILLMIMSPRLSIYRSVQVKVKSHCLVYFFLRRAGNWCSDRSPRATRSGRMTGRIKPRGRRRSWPTSSSTEHLYRFHGNRCLAIILIQRLCQEVTRKNRRIATFVGCIVSVLLTQSKALECTNVCDSNKYEYKPYVRTYHFLCVLEWTKHTN